MKNKIFCSLKKTFYGLAVFLNFALLFTTCDLVDQDPQMFLLDYGTAVRVATCNVSGINVPGAMQGGCYYISSETFKTITFYLENPGNFNIYPAITFANDIGATYTYNNLMVSITYPQAALQIIDGDLSRNNISPTIKIYRTQDNRFQSTYTLNLRCDTGMILDSSDKGLYISSTGNDTTGNGTINAPFATVKKVCQTIYDDDPAEINAMNADFITPKNVIYILDDMTITTKFLEGVITVASDAAFVLCGCKGGVKGAEITLYCDNQNAPSLYIEGNLKIMARNIKFTRSSSSSATTSAISIYVGDGLFTLRNCTVTGIKSSSGAVGVLGGMFRIDGKVIITGNEDATSSSPCNLSLAGTGYISFVTGLNIAGTKIGITVDNLRKPSNVGDIGVRFTISYKNACGTTSPSTYFTSDDSDYVVVWDSTTTDAALAKPGGNGTITPPTPPTSVTFSLSSTGGDGTDITVSAFSDGSTVTSDIISWNIELWQGSVKTPTVSDSNSITIPSTYAAGKYVIKVSGEYKGTTYNAELLYTKS